MNQLFGFLRSPRKKKIELKVQHCIRTPNIILCVAEANISILFIYSHIHSQAGERVREKTSSSQKKKAEREIAKVDQEEPKEDTRESRESERESRTRLREKRENICALNSSPSSDFSEIQATGESWISEPVFSPLAFNTRIVARINKERKTSDSTSGKALAIPTLHCCRPHSMLQCATTNVLKAGALYGVESKAFKGWK